MLHVHLLLGTPEDYVMNTSTILTFEPCQKKACREVFVVNDDVVEETESFNVAVSRTLLLGSAIVTEQRLQGMIRILDNDGGNLIKFVHFGRTHFFFCIQFA